MGVRVPLILGEVILAKTNFRVAVAILSNNRKIWIQKRKNSGHLAGYWEFPGGKIETNESPEQAVFREIKEELGINLRFKSKQLILVQPYSYPDRNVTIYFFFISVHNQPILEERRWVTWNELQHLQLPPANRAAVQKIRNCLCKR